MKQVIILGKTEKIFSEYETKIEKKDLVTEQGDVHIERLH
jgi:hypothetical protein